MAKKQIESKVLTVSEIAEKAGVSRNLVWSYVRKHRIKPVAEQNRKYRFDSSIVLKIKEKQEKKQVKVDENKSSDNISKDVLEILKNQLEIKDKQIRDQQQTIDFLRSEVIKARFEERKKQELLEDTKSKVEAISANGLKHKEKRRWWQRLFE